MEAPGALSEVNKRKDKWVHFFPDSSFDQLKRQGDLLGNKNLGLASWENSHWF